MSLKRKLSDFDPTAERESAGVLDLDLLFHTPEQDEIASPPAFKIPRRDSSHVGYDSSSCRLMGNKAVPLSLPLANMVSAVQELIDPEFEPVLEELDADFHRQMRFLKPLPSHIPAEDVEYLKSKGALTIPDFPLRNELLRAYVQWVYSFMPFLDLHDFLRAIAENDANANISLFLFQAVMFAGTAFVDIEHLKAAGFANRREARKAFYTRARLLYSFDYEDDRIASLQGLLLLTYHHERNGGLQKDIWYWIGVCHTQAQSIGLHRDPTKSDMDPDTQRLRIRLWWCLYSRDRLVSLALRRPTQINEGICDVPLLRITDFDFKPFPVAVSRMLLGCEHMGDVLHQKRLATMFIEKVKLCQCLGRVLFAQYVPSNTSFGATQNTTITLIPRQASDAELERCSQRLDTWVSNLPKEATFNPPPGKQLHDGENVLLLHSSMLRMIYHATCTALYRPRASLSAPRSTTTIKMLDTARQKMRAAASDTADIVHGLNRLGLTKFLPSSSLTVVTPAAVVHLTNLTSTNPSVRDESAWNFRQCIDVLNDLKDIYPAADYETACLQKAAQIQYGQQQVANQNPIVIMAATNSFADLANQCHPTTNHRNDYSPDNHRTIVELEDDEFDDPSGLLPSFTAVSENEQNFPQSHRTWDWNQDIFKEWIISSDDDGGSRTSCEPHQRGNSHTTSAMGGGTGCAIDGLKMVPEFMSLHEPQQLFTSPLGRDVITGDLEKDLGFA